MRGHTDALQRLVAEMYAHGLSTRDIGQVTEALWEEYEAFATRALSGYKLEYMFVDAIYETLRQQGGVQVSSNFEKCTGVIFEK